MARRIVATMALLLTVNANAVSHAPLLDAQADEHDIILKIDPEGGTLAIDDHWQVRHRDVPDAVSFLLTPLYSKPEIVSITCGKLRLRTKSVASAVEGGDTRWTIKLDRPCPPSRRLVIHLRGTSHGDAPQFKVGSNGAFAGSSGEIWYPQHAYSDRERARITLTLPGGWTGWAVGQPQKDASANFVSQAPTKLAFAAGPYRDYQPDPAVPIRILTREKDVNGLALSGSIAKTFQHLRLIFGPRSTGGFALIDVSFGGEVAGTSENGAIFAEPGRMAEAFDVAYWGHEISHQWWGVDVRPKLGSPGAALLTEALAEYGAMSVIRVERGEPGLEAYRQTQRDRYDKLAASGQFRPLASFLPAGQSEPLIAHKLATTRGALALDCVANLAGRARFDKVLAGFAARWRNQPTSWAALDVELRAKFPEQSATIDQWLKSSEPELPICR